ncbi:MAG: hypothetical protein NC293_08960 [Roseburia sp.]|nr:hypothetical protein [Roseburia sp.]
MFLLNLKRFVKSPVFLIGTLVYIVILYLMQPVHVATGIEDISNSTLTTQSFSFFYFMMISYEFFYQIVKQNLEEIVCVSKMGIMKEKMYGILIFLGIDMILYIVYLTVSMIGTTSILHYFHMDWFWMLVKAYFMYHFLTYLFAILIGMLISMIRSRIKGIFALVVVFSFFSKIIYPIIMQCAASSEKGTHILDILGIMNRNYYVFCDLIYNYTTEAVNLQRIMFWVLLAISLFLLVVNKKRKKIVTGIMFVVTFVDFLFYMQPSGERYVYGNWGAYMDEQQYYSLLYWKNEGKADEHKRIGRTYQTPNFKITKYKAALYPKRVLHASVDVMVDQYGLDQYCFTLYHGYKLQKVMDQNGEELVFEQDIDHVLVKTNKAHHVEAIHFEYEGYSRKYVATSQALFLAGNFPYLPNAGWNEYMIEPIGDHWQVGYNLKGAMYPIYYDIQIDAGQKVYSNLKEIEANHYTGVSEGATFAASPFIERMQLKNCVVYYPVLAANYRGENLEKTGKKYEDAVDALKRKEQEKGNLLVIFDLSSVMDADISWYIAKDHMIASADQLQELYDYYMEAGCTIDHTKWDKEEADLEGN